MSFTIDPRWRWHYDPDAEVAPAYRLREAPVSARGAIELYMPGATAEQFAEVRRGLIERFNPASEMPARRFVPVELEPRAGRHNSAR